MIPRTTAKRGGRFQAYSPLDCHFLPSAQGRDENGRMLLLLAVDGPTTLVVAGSASVGIVTGDGKAPMPKASRCSLRPIAVDRLPRPTTKLELANDWQGTKVKRSSATPMIAKAVSVCHARDIEVWGHVAPAVLSYIAASNYEVVVPDSDVELFVEASPRQYKVVPESHYLGIRDVSWLRARLRADQSSRLGWFLQQFIKIEAVRQSHGSDVVLIWDADTIPLQKMVFEKSSKLIFYRGLENHRSYFLAVSALLDIQKTVDFSFIAQCFPARSAWIQQMCAEIEERHGSHWIDVAVAYVAATPDASFSEYELMGTYLFDRHPNETTTTPHRWFRFGGRLLGSPNNMRGLRRRLLENHYDYVSFEHWDFGHRTIIDRWRNAIKWAELSRRYWLP